jgi:hypothetical protein
MYPRGAFDTPSFTRFAGALENYIKLAEKVLDQTCRRVFNNETVQAQQKIVSITVPCSPRRCGESHHAPRH